MILEPQSLTEAVFQVEDSDTAAHYVKLLIGNTGSVCDNVRGNRTQDIGFNHPVLRWLTPQMRLFIVSIRTSIIIRCSPSLHVNQHF